MKLDVLDGLEEVKVVIGYSDGSGGLTRSLPGHEVDWKEVCPVEKPLRVGGGPLAALNGQTYLQRPKLTSNSLRTIWIAPLLTSAQEQIVVKVSLCQVF